MFTRTLAGNTNAAFEVYDPPRAVLVGVDIGDRWPEERESGMSIAGKSIRFRERRAKQTGDEVAAPRGAARKSRKDIEGWDVSCAAAFENLPFNQHNRRQLSADRQLQAVSSFSRSLFRCTLLHSTSELGPEPALVFLSVGWIHPQLS